MYISYVFISVVTNTLLLKSWYLTLFYYSLWTNGINIIHSINKSFNFAVSKKSLKQYRILRLHFQVPFETPFMREGMQTQISFVHIAKGNHDLVQTFRQATAA